MHIQMNRIACVVLGIACACLSVSACRRSVAPADGVTRSPSASGATSAEPTVHGAPAAPIVSPTTEGALRRAPACDLITRAEMADILGAPIGKPAADNSDSKTSCMYPPGDASSYSQAEVAIEWDHGEAPSFERQLVDAFGGNAVGRQVAHDVRLGDQASYSMEGVLSVQTGRTLITITLPMRPESEQKALAIGQKLLGRLGATTRTEAPAAAPTTSLAGPGVKTPTNAAAPLAPAPAASPSASPKFPDGLSIGGECPSAPAGAIDAAASALVPLKEGLTLSHTWTPNSADPHDYECLVQVTAVRASYIDVTQSCPVGNRTVVGQRRICLVDLNASYFYLTETFPELPPVISGSTMFSLSSHSFHALKTDGKTRHRYIEVADAWRTSAQTLGKDTDGTLSSTRFDREPYKMIVNDRLVELPAIVGMAYLGTHRQTIAKILDDERFPLVLDYAVAEEGFEVRYTKISYPTGGEIEKRLATEKHVDVYGIYFDFASDRLRPESAPVLNEIAGVLGKNADWKLGINGHTDNIGSDPTNMDLSRRRSEAVRRALVETYHIDPARLTTAGFGAAQPKESNETIEGRAKNRRVELVRQ